MVYDYAILGAGAAGLQLALALGEDPYFGDKSILILEQDQKNTNDKTWCFWEKGDGAYDEIISAVWDKTLFYGENKRLEIPLGAYRYKMMRALDFYEYAKAKISQMPNIDWKNAVVSRVDENFDVVTIEANELYQAHHVFDSRTTIDRYDLEKTRGVWQHFKGWEIETPGEAFDMSAFTMMDYRLKWPGTSSFSYILPFNRNKALIEFTFFSRVMIEDNEYDKMLERYILEILQLPDYKINAVEKGAIPMFDYPFHKGHTARVTKIGTAGGWVKPSSGYSFKSAGKKCEVLLNNIKEARPPHFSLHSTRYALYDSTFLKVLQEENILGEQLFTTMYTKNNIEHVLAFLDENTSFSQELNIMNTFPKWKFMKAMATVVLD